VPVQRRRRWTEWAAALVLISIAAGAGAYMWRSELFVTTLDSSHPTFAVSAAGNFAVHYHRAQCGTLSLRSHDGKIESLGPDAAVGPLGPAPTLDEDVTLFLPPGNWSAVGTIDQFRPAWSGLVGDSPPAAVDKCAWSVTIAPA